MRHSKIDQENLQVKIASWEEEYSEDKFFFRPNQEPSQDVHYCSYTENDDSDTVETEDILEDMARRDTTSDECSLLFVGLHQTKWQRHLMAHYGSEICLLDATYKTVRYALPLFFVCFKTNVGYQVVGSFISQYEQGRVQAGGGGRCPEPPASLISNKKNLTVKKYCCNCPKTSNSLGTQKNRVGISIKWHYSTIHGSLIGDCMEPL